jgi:hypothetical protein
MARTTDRTSLGSGGGGYRTRARFQSPDDAADCYSRARRRFSDNWSMEGWFS